MSVLVTVKNGEWAKHPVEQQSFTADVIPRVGELLWLHDQGRTARVDDVQWMIRWGHEGSGGIRGKADAVVLVVTGTEPR